MNYLIASLIRRRMTCDGDRKPARFILRFRPAVAVLALGCVMMSPSAAWATLFNFNVDDVATGGSVSGATKRIRGDVYTRVLGVRVFLGNFDFTTTGSSFNVTGIASGDEVDWRVDISQSGYIFSPTVRTGTAGGTATVSPLFIRSSNISGRVTDHLTGGGASGVVVTATASGKPTRSDTTDANGNYTITGLGAGTYLLTPSRTNVSFTPTSQSVVSGPTKSGINFVLSNHAPTINNVPNQVTDEDTPTIVPFTLADVDVAASTLTVTAGSSNSALVPVANIELGGGGGNRTATITPAFNGNGSSTITLTVSDGGLTASDTFLLTVNAVNDPPTAGPATAMQFNSTNDYVQVPGFGGVIPSGEITVEFWQKISAGGPQVPFSLIPNQSTNRFEARTPDADGNVYWEFGNINSGGRLNYTPPSSLVGTWQHFAFVASANGNFMRIYRNGVPVPEAQKDGVSSFAAGNYDLRVGELFTGNLADFRVWSIARTASEIRQNRDVPLTGSEPGLILYYRFIEGSGPTVNDFASAAGTHPGTLINNPTWLAHGASPDLPSLVNVDEDTPKTIILPGFDFETAVANLTFSITATPTNGTLMGNPTNSGSSIVYQPNLNYTGPDHFTYRVSDGQLQATAGISIIVRDANDLPTISTIANQTTEENEILGPIPFGIGDPDNDANTLTLSALSLDPSLVNSANVVFGGSGSNRNLTITPQPGESGTVTILVTVFNGLDSTSTSFDLRVEQKPAFAIVDLGALPTRPVTTASALNDLGSAAGKASANSQSQQSRAFLFNGLENGSVMTEIGTLGGASSEAFGINNLNVVVGDALDTNGFIHAFRYNGVSVTDLGTLLGGTESHARAINDEGVVAGYARTGGGLDRAVTHSGSGLTMITNLTGNLTNFATQSRAFALNNSNQVAGAAYNAGGASRAFLYNRTNMIDLGALPGHQTSVANGINRFAQVVGTSFSSNAPSQAFLYANGTLTGVGTLLSGGNSEARGINDFGQVVGWAISSNGQQRATFFSAGRLRDLNDLIPEDTGWTLLQANAINNRGEIIGSGVFGGQTRAFLAIPANVMGKQVTRPQGAVARVPDIELLDAQPGDTPQNAFYFSNADKKLYAVRPVTARLRWPVSANLLDTNRITAISVSVWPKTPQIHVVNTPVELEPLPNFPYTFLNLLYSTTPEANVDAGTRVFTSAQPGHSVLLYLKTDGLTPNPDIHRPYFEVVRSVLWNHPQHLIDLQPWSIGTPITDSFHADHPGRNGHVFFENAFYDGAGTDRAYDRATRAGPIIPVNGDTPAETNDMVVVWYRTNQINVAWPSKPVRYTPEWAANAPQIVIASTQGSEVLDPILYPSMRLYNQPDPAQPGFNPNEEHAFLAANPASGGQSIFALRSDLNKVIGASDAFCLLKYRDTASEEWRLKVYHVIRENATYPFRYAGLAGGELLPPYPLSVLTLCPASHGVSGPYWEDVNGRLYASAAGLSGDLKATVVARFFYPLLPEFFYDLDRNGTPDAPVGACIPWLDRRPGGVQNQPIDVQYTIRWPETAPVLQIGESLLTPKRGLPDILNAAKMEIIFDASNPTGADLLASAVRLYDPLSERVLKVPGLGHIIENPAAFQIPAVIAKQNVAGKEVFTALPSHISSRLRYDPLNKWFMFHGILDESFVGEPLLLPNVLTERERDRIQDLDGSGNETDFDKVIEALYDLTRNPNRVDLTPKDGLPDKALRIGLAMNGQNVILEPLAEAKALTAGLASAPPPTYAPGQAVNFDGADDSINAGTAVPLVNTSFTIEFWAKHATGGPGDEFIIGQGSAGSGLGLRIGFLADDRFSFDFGNAALITTQMFADAEWHHWACTYDSETARRTIYLDGRAVASDVTAQIYTGSGTFWIGRGFSGGFFRGMVDDVRIWNTLRGSFQVQSDRSKRLLGTETGLLRYFRFDLDSGTTVRDESATGVNATLVGGATRVASDAPTGIAPRFVTLAENNDASLGLPVTLKIIRVEDGPFKGDLKVLAPENVFDEKVTLRHSSDFGAEPELIDFEWYY